MVLIIIEAVVYRFHLLIQSDSLEEGITISLCIKG